MKTILAVLLLAGTSLASPEHYNNAMADVREYVTIESARGTQAAHITNVCNAYFARLIQDGYLTRDEWLRCRTETVAMLNRIAQEKAARIARSRVPSDADRIIDAIERQNQQLRRQRWEIERLRQEQWQSGR